MSALRVGVIGTGMMGEVHARLLSERIGSARVVAVSDPDVGRRREVADLTSYVPASEGYDLVLIVYLHLGAAELPLIIEGAARAVAPGGRLVVVGHDVENLERGTGGPQMAEVLTTVPGVLAALEPVGLTIDRAEVAERPVIAADGSAAIALDTVVVGRRA